MNSLKNAFFLIIGLSIILWSFYAFLQKSAPVHYQNYIGRTYVVVGKNNIEVEIADTEEERAQGLSDKGTLETGHGVLFIFDEPAKYGFWMKNMHFPIDIVWIDENWKVVGIERLINPNTYPKAFYPPDNIKYVLEIPAGEAQKYDIDIGQFISYLQKK
ncbi:MAG: DUF192 domain-containing protein [Candidatus Zambryskibacteria bacterium]|nr:DUF192 domain-containing protein [Candidatus Zambryskibacteria bacterium]